MSYKCRDMVKNRPSSSPCFLLPRCFFSQIFCLHAANEKNIYSRDTARNEPNGLHFCLSIPKISLLQKALPTRSPILLGHFPTGLQYLYAYFPTYLRTAFFLYIILLEYNFHIYIFLKSNTQYKKN
jgi:hypothetical protein